MQNNEVAMDKENIAEKTNHVDDVSTPSSPPQALSAENDGEFEMTIGKWLAIVSFQLGFLSDVFALTMVGAALLTINRDIGPSDNFTWMVTAQIVGQSVLAPQCGRFADIFGRRKFLLVGNVIGIVGCILAATSKNVNTCIGGNTLIGIGGSMHQLAWTCLGEVVPKRSRGLALGLFETSLIPASVFGSIIAFGFIKNGSWRPIFWLCFALDAASFVLVFFFYWPMNQYIHEEGKTAWDQVKETDFLGCFLFAAGLTLFLLGISFGGAQFAWKSATVIALIVVGACTLIVLGFWSAYNKLTYSAFPKEIFSNVRGVTIILVAIYLYGMAYYASAVLWPQQIQALYTQDPITVGWYGMAVGVGGSVFSPLAGLVFRRYGKSQYILPCLLAGLTIVSGASAIAPDNNKAATALTILIGGFVGSTSVISTAVIQVGVAHEFIGIATGLTICMRAVGGSVGTTVYSTILQSRLKHNIVKDVALPLAFSGLDPTVLPAVVEALSTGDATNPVLLNLTPKMIVIAIDGLKKAWTDSFRIVYLVTIAFGVVGTLVVCFSANTDHLLSHRIDIKLDEGAHINANTDTGEGHVIRHGIISPPNEVAEEQLA